MSEPITGTNRAFFEKCIAYARRFMLLPQTVELYYDDCPSPRFPCAHNAAESAGNKIWFNKQWVYERIGPHREDVAFYLFHELRHLYQQAAIGLWQVKKELREPLMVLRSWRNDFTNYIRNVDAATQEQNLRQDIERDANAYALILTILYFNKPNGVRLSLPAPALEQADKDMIPYLRDRDEFKPYVQPKP